MQNYFGTRIINLLPRINKEIFLPSIQRPYVWEPDQILKLFDSLMRGYPINTFLFWELQPENLGDWAIYRFVRDFRHGDIHNDDASLSGEEKVILVLDGQQRLTSLLIGLGGSYTVRNGARGKGSSWITKVLYLNLLQSPEVEEEDDDGVTVRELYYGFRFFAVERVPKNDINACWFKVQDIVPVVDESQLEATIQKLLLLNPDLEESRQELLRENLTRLWQVVHRDECLAYYLERTQSYDKVLDIFIRANDGGTKLSRSDLLMSMVTLRWDQFNARSETEAVTYTMREVLKQDTGFDRDYLLRSGLFFNDLDFGFQLRNFTPRNIAIIEANWVKVKRALLMAADLFNRFDITGSSLTGVNAVMLIGCYLYKSNRGRPLEEWFVSGEDQERIRRWISAVFFHGVLGGTANVTMEFYRRALNEHLRSSGTFPMEILAERMAIRGRNMAFDDNAVSRFIAQEFRSRNFDVSLRLLYARTDWSAKDWKVVQVIPSHRLLDDRLQLQGVSDADIRVYQSWANRLANYVVLNDEEAREYYSMDLEDWVRTRTSEFWLVHHLPDNPALYEEFNFLNFVQDRKRRIGAYLENVLKEERNNGEVMQYHAAVIPSATEQVRVT
mgnify:CR=1 FL=1|jgi:Uncharacterized conserved protein